MNCFLEKACSYRPARTEEQLFHVRDYRMMQIHVQNGCILQGWDWSFSENAKKLDPQIYIQGARPILIFRFHVTCDWSEASRKEAWLSHLNCRICQFSLPDAVWHMFQRSLIDYPNLLNILKNVDCVKDENTYDQFWIKNWPNHVPEWIAGAKMT